MKDNDLEELGGFVKAPEFVKPWLDRFYEPIEVRIIRDIKHNPMDEKMLQKVMELSHDTMDRFFKRRVLSKNKEGNLIPGDFHARYDIWALFEGYSGRYSEPVEPMGTGPLYQIPGKECGAYPKNRSARSFQGNPPVSAS